MNELAIQQSDNGGLRELALFAGAGGGILGGKLLGWRTRKTRKMTPSLTTELRREIPLRYGNGGEFTPTDLADVCTKCGAKIKLVGEVFRRWVRAGQITWVRSEKGMRSPRQFYTYHGASLEAKVTSTKPQPIECPAGSITVWHEYPVNPVNTGMYQVRNWDRTTGYLWWHGSWRNVKGNPVPSAFVMAWRGITR